MIAIRLQGRLGNQLFQYAFIYSAAKKTKSHFYLDQYLEKSLVHQYFQIDTNVVDNISSFLFNVEGFKNIFNIHLKKYINRLLIHVYNLKIIQYEFAEDESAVEFKNGTLYIGYFQSLLYMKSYENLIRQQLSVKQKFSYPFKKQFDELYKDKTIVTIHIRRTDYKMLGHLNLGNDDLTLPLSYYHNAIANIKDKNLHYIFISDDISFIEDNFGGIKPKTISKASEIYDFQHLLNSKICIISNSTFSWWGAWLNSRKDKIVYCPQYYLGHYLKKQIPQNIYPKEWRQIDFD